MVSFADLALLLLGCFVLLNVLQAPGSAAPAAARRGEELTAASLFHPGEARLTAAGRRRLQALAAGDGRPHIVSLGDDAATSRFDAFELAAARAAAAGRALAKTDDAPAGIIVAPGAEGPQRLYISFR